MNIIESSLRESTPLLETERLSSPLWLRAGPSMPEILAQQIPGKFRRLIPELGANAFSSDLSPFRSNWVMKARERIGRCFENTWGTPVNIDYEFSTTQAAISVLLNMVDSIGKGASVFIGRPKDGWRLRQFEQCVKLTGRLVDNLESADIVFLTHGTPEMGLSSIDFTSRTSETQRIIIDAATDWPTFFLEPYKSIISNLMSQRKVVGIGDLQKVFGYTVQIHNSALPIPINLALMIYSPDLFQERLSLSGNPQLAKNPNQLTHWQIVNTRSLSNSIGGANLLYGCAILEEFGGYLPEWTEIACNIARQLRNMYQLEGELTVVAGPMSDYRFSQNDPSKTFSVSSGHVLWDIEDVIPTFYRNGRRYGFFHVYPIYGYLGAEILFTLYNQIAQRVFNLA